MPWLWLTGVVFWALPLALRPVVGDPAREPAAPHLPGINQALRAWLRLIETDRPYLVVDRAAGEVRLQHGRAVLRACPVLADSFEVRTAGGAAGEADGSGGWRAEPPAGRPGGPGAFSGGLPPAEVQERIRRYRPSDAWSRPQAGPFDWEHVLVNQATGDCALYYANGLLIYASGAWGRPRAPSLRLGTGDLRALYNVADDGLPLVVLPPRWKGDSARGER